MSTYYATINWKKQQAETFVDNKYSRAHLWEFDGGEIVQASSSPHVVPVPYSVEANVDPEEAFIASLSSCHMLFFLSIAAKRMYVVESYIDKAYGVMQLNEKGKMAMTDVTLVPQIIFSGDRKPSQIQIGKMHHQAHEQCFIANSVKAEIVTEIVHLPD